MDGDDAEEARGSCCSQFMFRLFVFFSLSILLGMHLYANFGGTLNMDEDLSEYKFLIMQLTRGLTEVNQKHERLQSEIERLAKQVPQVAEAAVRAREALTSSSKDTQGHKPDYHHLMYYSEEYDRQMTDYALESAGARIIDTGSTEDFVIYESAVGWILNTLVSWACRDCPGARAMLRPGNMPGECWLFRGVRGEATVRLLTNIQVTGISLEHIPPNISPTKDISSAPRLFRLEGLVSRRDRYPHDFGTFEYNNNGRPIQYFAVLKPTTQTFLLVRISFLSNWGHPLYTCVYRVRIHGNLKNRAIDRSSEQSTVVVEEITNVDNE